MAPKAKPVGAPKARAKHTAKKAPSKAKSGQVVAASAPVDGGDSKSVINLSANIALSVADTEFSCVTKAAAARSIRLKLGHIAANVRDNARDSEGFTLFHRTCAEYERATKLFQNIKQSWWAEMITAFNLTAELDNFELPEVTPLVGDENRGDDSISPLLVSIVGNNPVASGSALHTLCKRLPVVHQLSLQQICLLLSYSGETEKMTRK